MNPDGTKPDAVATTAKKVVGPVKASAQAIEPNMEIVASICCRTAQCGRSNVLKSLTLWAAIRAGEGSRFKPINKRFQRLVYFGDAIFEGGPEPA